MAGSSQEKTEKPTGKKLSDARKRGKIARSTDLNTVVVLMAGGITALLSGEFIRGHFLVLLQEVWGGGFNLSTESGFRDGLFIVTVSHLFAMIAPVAGATLIAALAVNILQTKGLMFSAEAIQPDFSKLNPLSGFKKIFSVRSLLELGKSLVKVAIVSFAIYSVMRSEEDVIMNLAGMDVLEIARVLGSLAFKILIRAGGIMLILAMADFYYQRWQYMRDLRMTKQEVKEEHKQSEGNPQVKSRIRSIQRSLIRQRMMASVPKASVVITNPTHFAVAILYDSQMEAPKIVAKGVDFLAKTIINTARKHGVPVFQNPPLARALYHQVKLEESIPVNLYRAVAKVLAYIYQQKKQRPQ